MEYEIKPVGRFSFNLQELLEYRELVYFFTWRDLKVKYKQTFIGAAWAIIQPVLFMLIFTVFFAGALKIPSGDLPYPVFVFAGILLWNVFSSGLQNAGNSMVSNANIIKKIYFPRLIIPISSIISSLVDFFIALAFYLVIIIYYNFSSRIPSLLLVLPISLIITLFTTLGLGSFFAALNVKYRDFRYIVPFFVQVLMFLSPIIYPVSIIHIDWLEKVLLLNPMAGAIDLLRSVLTQSPINWGQIAVSFSISCILLLVGIYYFRKTEYYFADLA